MYVERSAYVELLGYVAGDFLYSPDSFDVQFLRRELYCCVSGVYTCELDMLAYCVGNYVAVLGYSVHFYFLGMLYEAAYNYGMVFRYLGCQLQEALKFLIVGAYVHGCS